VVFVAWVVLANRVPFLEPLAQQAQRNRHASAGVDRGPAGSPLPALAWGIADLRPVGLGCIRRCLPISQFQIYSASGLLQHFHIFVLGAVAICFLQPSPGLV